jgi:hypothetical protein
MANEATYLHQVLHEACKSTAKTLEMLCEAVGKHSLSRTAVFEWHSHFKASQVSVEDDERSGRPGTSKMKKKMLKNFRTDPQRPSLNNP